MNNDRDQCLNLNVRPTVYAVQMWWRSIDGRILTSDLPHRSTNPAMKHKTYNSNK